MRLGNSNLFHLAAIVALLLLLVVNSVYAADITISDGWFRALPPSVPSGGYFKLHNGSSKTISLKGAQSPGCESLMLHKTMEKGGMGGRMHVMEIPVPAGDDLVFAPGGYHLMCMGAKPILQPGGTVPVTLSFADGATLTANFQVRNASGK